PGATLAKLSALVALPPLAILLLAAPRLPAVRAVARDVATLLAPMLLAWGLLLSFIDPAQVVDQLLLFRVRAREAFPTDYTTYPDLLGRIVGASLTHCVFPTPTVGEPLAQGRRLRLLTFLASPTAGVA